MRRAASIAWRYDDHGNEPWEASVGRFDLVINATCNKTWYPSVQIRHDTLVDGPPVPDMELAKELCLELYKPFEELPLEKAQARARAVRRRLYEKHRPDMLRLLYDR